MIKVTLNEILNAIPVFNELSNRNFKSSTSFKIARMINTLNKEIEVFNTEREKLIEKYCEKDDNNFPVITETGMVKIKENFIEECNKELKELLKVEIEMNLDKMNEEVFEEAELTPNQVMMIMSFVE